MRLLILPMVFLLSLVAIAQEQPYVVDQDVELPFEALPPDTLSTFTSVERSAGFPGGFLAMVAYLGKENHYPKEEQEDRIEGKVVLHSSWCGAMARWMTSKYCAECWVVEAWSVKPFAW